MDLAEALYHPAHCPVVDRLVRVESKWTSLDVPIVAYAVGQVEADGSLNHFSNAEQTESSGLFQEVGKRRAQDGYSIPRAQLYARFDQTWKLCSLVEVEAGLIEVSTDYLNAGHQVEVE